MSQNDYYVQCLKVAKVAQGTQADALGIAPGDIVRKYNGLDVNSDQELSRSISSARSAELDAIEIVVTRIVKGEATKIELSVNPRERLGITCMEGKERGSPEDSLKHVEKYNNYNILPNSVMSSLAKGIIMTTSMSVASREIEKEIDVISVECAYEKNAFLDMFAEAGDEYPLNGRSKPAEEVLKDAVDAAKYELRTQAVKLGADAVIGVDIDFNELSVGRNRGLLVAIGTGTAVSLKAG